MSTVFFLSFFLFRLILFASIGSDTTVCKCVCTVCMYDVKFRFFFVVFLFGCFIFLKVHTSAVTFGIGQPIHWCRGTCNDSFMHFTLVSRIRAALNVSSNEKKNKLNHVNLSRSTHIGIIAFWLVGQLTNKKNVFLLVCSWRWIPTFRRTTILRKSIEKSKQDLVSMMFIYAFAR